jgi:hypothetical protein
LSLGNKKCLSDANETTKNDVKTKTFVVFVVVDDVTSKKRGAAAADANDDDVVARVAVHTKAFVSSVFPDSSHADVAFNSLSSMFSPSVWLRRVNYSSFD